MVPLAGLHTLAILIECNKLSRDIPRTPGDFMGNSFFTREIRHEIAVETLVHAA